MPRVPSYQPNQIGPVQTTEARFRPANNNGGAFGAIGEGLQGLGEAGAEYAVTQDRINAQADENYARTLALDFKSKADPIVSQYGTLEGKNAVDVGAQTQDQIHALRDQTLAAATSPRMKRYLEQFIAPASTEYLTSVATHSIKQQKVMAVGTANAEVDMAANQAAASINDPAKFAQHRADAEAAVGRLADLQGWGEAERKDATFKVVSDMHSSAITQALATEDVDMAHAYFDAHKDEMTVSDRNSALQALKAPLELRDSVAGFAEIVSGAPGPAASAAPLPTAGLITAGNIDIHNRPVVKNRDGSISTVRTISIGADEGEVLIPTVVGGKVVSDRAAIDHYRKTGEHLGIFDTPEHATAYAKSLHNEQAREYGAGGTYQRPVAGTVTNTYAQHEARGSHGLDIGASLGSAIHPIAGGVVTAVSQDARSGKFIQVRHPDGHTSSYSHMGNQSVAVGDSVGPETVLGTVGMTGHTTGPHVHLRVKDSAGHDVDPEKLMGRESPAGTVVGSPQAARNWDQASVIAEIDKRTDWSIEKRERVKDYARKRMGQDEQLLQDRRSDADEAASAIVLGKREGFTDTSMIPRSIWNTLSVADQAKYEAVAKTNRTPKDPVANGSDALALNIKRFYDPEGFKRENLGQYVGKVTRAEMDGLLQEQAKMRTAAPADWSPRQGIVTAVSYGKRIGGLDLKGEDEAAVMQIMETEARQLYLANGKKPLTDDQYTALFRSATRNVTTHRQIFGMKFGGSETPRYQLTEGQMPSSTRERLNKKLRAELGRDPSDDELLAAFRIESRR